MNTLTYNKIDRMNRVQLIKYVAKLKDERKTCHTLLMNAQRPIQMLRYENEATRINDKIKYASNILKEKEYHRSRHISNFVCCTLGLVFIITLVTIFVKGGHL